MNTDLAALILYAAFLFALYTLYREYLRYLEGPQRTVYVASEATVESEPKKED